MARSIKNKIVVETFTSLNLTQETVEQEAKYVVRQKKDIKQCQLTGCLCQFTSFWCLFC